MTCAQSDVKPTARKILGLDRCDVCANTRRCPDCERPCDACAPARIAPAVVNVGGTPVVLGVAARA